MRNLLLRHGATSATRGRRVHPRPCVGAARSPREPILRHPEPGWEPFPGPSRNRGRPQDNCRVG
ncbi:Hypothetical protein AA314_04717 [Archangium gephyra]|uniref:Uncharacterized protein n=1 Tax=Archangium gephyra TaxID=48 RepID=A0AAC8TFZ3_9BACT|nr:Hypothetical protein AA314_04717 [Archangium gephyra]